VKSTVMLYPQSQKLQYKAHHKDKNLHMLMSCDNCYWCASSPLRARCIFTM